MYDYCAMNGGVFCLYMHALLDLQQTGLADRKLDMTSLVEELAKRAVVYQVPGISRAFLTDSQKPGEEGTHLKTEGIDIQVKPAAFYKFDCYNLHLIN